VPHIAAARAGSSRRRRAPAQLDLILDRRVHLDPRPGLQAVLARLLLIQAQRHTGTGRLLGEPLEYGVVSVRDGGA
jgi:hypothetical protein